MTTVALFLSLLLFCGDNLIKIIGWLSRLVENLGMSTRIFDLFLEGEIVNSTGRDRLAEKVITAILQEPIWGYGIMGDWVITGNIYVHNIFLEMWCQFGLILGTIILAVVIGLPLYVMFKYLRKKDVFLFMFMLFCIVDLLECFRAQPETLVLPEIPAGSFTKKLYSTYLSYLPKGKTAFPLKMNVDARGSFTELLKTEKCGQFSVNISKPGITKGEHWHNSKWEFFIVVAGHGLIQERCIGSDEVWEFEVSGEKIEAVHMLPGFTHNIINLSDTEPLVTLMWANEQFDPAHPDTYGEKVGV